MLTKQAIRRRQRVLPRQRAAAHKKIFVAVLVEVARGRDAAAIAQVRQYVVGCLSEPTLAIVDIKSIAIGFMPRFVFHTASNNEQVTIAVAVRVEENGRGNFTVAILLERWNLTQAERTAAQIDIQPSCLAVRATHV